MQTERARLDTLPLAGRCGGGGLCTCPSPSQRPGAVWATLLVFIAQARSRSRSHRVSAQADRQHVFILQPGFSARADGGEPPAGSRRHNVSSLCCCPLWTCLLCWDCMSTSGWRSDVSWGVGGFWIQIRGDGGHERAGPLSAPDRMVMNERH